jgi:uncharacterized RmlC-like cupin family protein
MPDNSEMDWKTNGVRVIPGDSLDANTAQTPGMSRAAAANLARVGARKLWAVRCRLSQTPRPARIITAHWRV